LTEEGPEIYIFDGDDEFAIHESVSKVVNRLGDAAIAEMNTVRLDGRSVTLAQLKDASASVPFLAAKRIVILTHLPPHQKDKKAQEEFLAYLSSPKPTSKLLLVEYEFLTRDRDRRDGKLHWLEKWATSPEQLKRVFLRHHPQPGGALMVRWIQDHVKSLGGQITPQASVSLASQVGDDTRIASQEIIKLLTYVGASRPIEPDDVEHLTPLTAKIGDFELVNAIRDRNQRKAQALLHRSLQEDDPLRILQSIVYQFRVLIIAREILDEHGTLNDFPKSLKIGYYPSKLALESASTFTTKFLEDCYHQLLRYDEAIKNGQMDGDLALDLLVIELTT
jgi:DNA polymerase III subunit delta